MISQSFKKQQTNSHWMTVSINKQWWKFFIPSPKFGGGKHREETCTLITLILFEIVNPPCSNMMVYAGAFLLLEGLLPISGTIIDWFCYYSHKSIYKRRLQESAGCRGVQVQTMCRYLGRAYVQRVTSFGWNNNNNSYTNNTQIKHTNNKPPLKSICYVGSVT